MTLYDLVKKYGKGLGEKSMWSSVKVISDEIDPMRESNPEWYWNLLKKTYCAMNGGHFNEEFARWQVEQMYYTDKEGTKHHAPYWNEDDMKAVYNKAKSEIPSAYNYYDFCVTMNMLKSDNYCMLKKWNPNATEEQLDAMIVDMSINYLNDPDAPYPTEKIWRYIMS
jgi:hypothetical protein